MDAAMTAPIRDYLWLGCNTGKHDWVFVGGANAGCCKGTDDCCCSIPVHECAKCGDCDYGDNDEAAQVIELCASLGRQDD